MAQGNSKKKSANVPSLSKRKKKIAKPLGPRKGRYIAPKKADKVRSEKLKKDLQKKIGERIERDVHQEALKEGNEFRLLQGTTTSQSVQKNKKNS